MLRNLEGLDFFPVQTQGSFILRFYTIGISSRNSNRYLIHKEYVDDNVNKLQKSSFAKPSHDDDDDDGDDDDNDDDDDFLRFRHHYSRFIFRNLSYRAIQRKCNKANTLPVG